MHTRGVTFFLKLIVASSILLAVPGSAMAAEFAVTGPASVGEAAGKATYTIACGDTEGIPNAGVLTVAAADGPAPPATAGEDYGSPSSAAFTCPPPPAGPATVDVPITNDTADEVDERFTVTVSGALGPVPTSVSQSVTTTIVDDDPVASITPLVRILEGDSGTTAAELTVTLATAAAQATTIGYATQDASAVAGGDYAATSGQLTIPVGQSTGTISVPIVGDATPERVEAFYVNLTSTNNGSLDPTKKQGAVAVFDTDKGPLLALSLPAGVTTAEGAGGTVNALFTVRLSSAATERVEVAWKTSNFTATLSDYARANGKVVFRPGQTTKTISVDIKGDRRDEPDEAFAVRIQNPVGATIARKGSFGIIADDDGPKVAIGKPTSRPRALVVRVACPRSASRCKGRLVGTAGTLKFGRARFDLAPGASRKVKLKPSPRARAALRKRARRVKLSATAADATGDTRVTVRRVSVERRS